jgi:predicted nucleic acid-binding Zn ribbon protein
MAKAKSFADKVAKNQMDFHKHCPKCGEAINNIKLVKSEKSGNSWRYNEKHVGVCKCNAADVVK